LHLNISKVNRVLHLPSHLLLPRLGVSSTSWHRLGICSSPLFSMLVMFRTTWAPLGRAKWRWKSTIGGRPDGPLKQKRKFYKGLIGYPI
jgi:hypothetical protein